MLKLLVTLLLIAGAVLAYRFLGERGRRRRDELAEKAARMTRDQIQDLRKCPSCGAYAPAGERCACGERL